MSNLSLDVDSTPGLKPRPRDSPPPFGAGGCCANAPLDAIARMATAATILIPRLNTVALPFDSNPFAKARGSPIIWIILPSFPNYGFTAVWQDVI
jgi:hypothetical protein